MDPKDCQYISRKSNIRRNRIKSGNNCRKPNRLRKNNPVTSNLNEAGYAENGVIGITQPRRIATLSVSEYMAKQLKQLFQDTLVIK